MTMSIFLNANLFVDSNVIPLVNCIMQLLFIGNVDLLVNGNVKLLVNGNVKLLVNINVTSILKIFFSHLGKDIPSYKL